MLINATLSAFQNLLNLVGQTNPLAPTIHVDQVTVGEVTVLAPSVEVPYNSEVTLTAVDTKGFTGAVTVRYNRLALDVLALTVSSEVAMFPDTTAAQCVNLIAAHYNVISGEFELVGSFKTPLMVNVLPLTLGLKPTSVHSLTYVGQEIAVTLVWPDTSEQFHTLLHTVLPSAGYL